jgi:hypothetical protein
MTKAKDGSHWICRCECGGQVRGVHQFGRLFSWCTVCTPVVKVDVPSALNAPLPQRERNGESK